MSGTFKVEFSTDNAAFECDGATVTGRNIEIARILRQIAEQVDNDEESGSVRDANGNKVGTWGVK